MCSFSFHFGRSFSKRNAISPGLLCNILTESRACKDKPVLWYFAERYLRKIYQRYFTPMIMTVES